MRLRRKAYHRTSSSYSDDRGVNLGAAGRFEWSTDDANANLMVLNLPSGGSVDVPVFVSGIDIKDTDLGLFDGITQPWVGAVDADKDAAIGLTFSADDTPGIEVKGTFDRTYTIPDAGADATFLMTDSYRTVWGFACGLSGEDTDGAGTNGAGMTGGAVDLTTNQFDDGSGTVSVKIYDHGTTTWDDLSTSSSLTGWTANYQLQPDADSEEAGDAFAIGFSTKFCEVAFNDLSTGSGAMATYAADCGKWQYSTGDGTWDDLTVYDGTDSTAQDGKRPLQRAGAISFAPPSDWVAATYDGQEAYWIQWVFTAAQLTQSALIDTTNKDEPFVVIPNDDAFSAPFKATIGKIRVTDMGATVHDAAVKFVVGNFTTGTFTEEFTWTASQYNDTFSPSTPLAVASGDKVGVLITDDGGSTANPVLHVEFEATYLD